MGVASAPMFALPSELFSSTFGSDFMRIKAVVTAGVAMVLGVPAAPSLAQSAAQFPTKNITIIVPPSPGGAIDLLHAYRVRR